MKQVNFVDTGFEWASKRGSRRDGAGGDAGVAGGEGRAPHPAGAGPAYRSPRDDAAHLLSAARCVAAHTACSYRRRSSGFHTDQCVHVD